MGGEESEGKKMQNLSWPAVGLGSPKEERTAHWMVTD